MVKRMHAPARMVGRMTGRAALTGAAALTLIAGAAGTAGVHAAGKGLRVEAHVAPRYTPHPGVVPYNGGPIMPKIVAYNIFYQPPGTHFDLTPNDTAAGDTAYENAMNQFITDLNGTSYYNIMSQYTGTNGTPQDSVTLAGSTVVTQVGGVSPTALTSQQEEDLVLNAIQAHNWPNTQYQTEYFLYTAQGVSEQGGPAACGYHSTFNDNSTNNQDLVWSFMPANGGSGGGCDDGLQNVTTWPHDPVIDIELSTLTHEVFESASDPTGGTGWVDNTVAGGQGEIGDLCDNVFGPINGANGNITLNGHHYLVQYIFSNTAVPAFVPSGKNACVDHYSTVTPTRVSHVRLVRNGSAAQLRWHVSMTGGIAGFRVYSSSHALTHVIALHAGRNYAVRLPAGSSHLTLHVLLSNGKQQVVQA